MSITRSFPLLLAVVAVGVVLGGAGRATAAQADHATDRPTRSCASNDNQFHRCQVGPWDDAELIRQDSRTRCVRGQNWDLDGTSLWVSDGCRGVFAEVRYRRPAATRRTASCASNDNRLQRCRVGAWADAELLRQDSRTRCVRGQNWDLDGTSLWVSGGCRGLFGERVRGVARHLPRGVPRHDGGYRDGWQPGPSWDREIRFVCSSTDNKYRFCTVDVGPRGRVRLIEQESRARCVEGQSWGWNRAGVWVDRGCRARFEVSRRR
ncbi:MAG TPA: DUF3011 domain-containing protein [Rhodanobacteraceae bacterium]|nr:DUF3011 domain-containing protein [Rhodanobacteraceae bacterium]